MAVWLVDSWEDFEKQAGGGRGLGTWQKRETADGYEVRVRCGRLGFIGVYKDVSNKEYGRIIDWVLHEGYLYIKGTVDDEVFHL